METENIDYRRIYDNVMNAVSKDDGEKQSRYNDISYKLTGLTSNSRDIDILNGDQTDMKNVRIDNERIMREMNDVFMDSGMGNAGVRADKLAYSYEKEIMGLKETLKAVEERMMSAEKSANLCASNERKMREEGREKDIKISELEVKLRVMKENNNKFNEDMFAEKAKVTDDLGRVIKQLNRER